jgi:AcrR family transcriptional regulator
MTREYELKRRAEQMEDTRRRIVEAAVELHQTVGPARTSVSAIAERAGVQRQTYYRHFPEERELLESCSGLFLTHNPLPDPESWRAIADLRERQRHGLTELYAYYRANEEMLSSVMRDAEIHPLTREMVVRFVVPGLIALRDALADGLQCDGEDPKVSAAFDLALDFNTWRLLVRRNGLSQDDAVALANAILDCLT